MTPPYPPPPPPPPPAPEPRPIRGVKVAVGIGIAIGLHILTIVVGVALLIGGNTQSALPLGFAVIVGGQLSVFIACMVVGISQLGRGDRGLGLGLLIGWAVGVIVLPVIGYGACVALMRSY